MTRFDFEDWLRYRLSDLPQEEVDRIAAFYMDAIEARMEDGMTEEQAIYDLGEPEALLEEIRADLPQHVIYKPVHKSTRPANRKNRIMTLILVAAILGVALPALVMVLNVSPVRRSQIIYEAVSVPVEAPAISWEGDESEYTFDPSVHGLNKVEISAALGRVSVEPCDDNWVHVIGNDESFDANVRGTTLYVENVNDDLLVRMPMAWYLRLSIDSDVGDVEIYEITAATLDVSADLGNIFLHNVTAAERINLAADVGNIEGSLKYRQEDYCIDVSVDLGQCNLTDSVNDGTPLTIAADLGSVKIAFED